MEQNTFTRLLLPKTTCGHGIRKPYSPTVPCARLQSRCRYRRRSQGKTVCLQHSAFGASNGPHLFGWSDSRNLRQQLSEAGLAGLVAYGISNTLYYTVAFLLVWFNVAKVPHGQGMASTARAVAKTLGLVWAGSQVTKVPRAAAALLAAPLMDRVLLLLQDKLRLKNKQQAFFRVILPACLGLALLLFASVILAWM